MRKKKNGQMQSEGTVINLSDFALFLSVMKNREAYESTLSIILEEPDLELKEVKVEQVVLNKSGKKAIRLDAWAMDSQNRQINTEMQNDTEKDDVRKRSRYYQGLLDSPILKSGRQTRYKDLPSTIIIFITQEDIFGHDRTKYSFTEQCEEVPGLHLGDGTKKIFVNMSSKNGVPELVSLMQYMKDTRIENPGITVKDKRILRLDGIVQEVRQSEEWEVVRMSILEIGLQRGEEIGLEKGEKIGREIGLKKGEEIGREIGLKKGEEIGKEIGKEIAKVELICRKLNKGKSPEIIAEELDVDPAFVQSVCEAAGALKPPYDAERLYTKWKKLQGKTGVRG